MSITAGIGRFWLLAAFLTLVSFLHLFADPGMSQIRHLGHDLQVVATEVVGVLPFVPIFIGTLKIDAVITDTIIVFVSPHGGFDGADADFMDGFVFCLHVGCMVVSCLDTRAPCAFSFGSSASARERAALNFTRNA